MSAPPATVVRGSGTDARTAPGSRGSALVLVAAILAAECVVAFVDPVAGAVAHAVLLLAALVRWVGAGDGAVLALSLVPFARLTSLALTPGNYGIASYVLTGLPLAVAVVWLLRGTVVGRSGPVPARLPWHALLVSLSGVPLGWAAHAVLDLPRLWEARTGAALVAAVPVVFFFAGALEEMLFRGVVQRTLAQRLGRTGVLTAALLHAAAYLPTLAPTVVIWMGGVGLVFGWYVSRTGRVVPVAVAHGLMAAGALVVWPVVL